jgi:hypothetical protein
VLSHYFVYLVIVSLLSLLGYQVCLVGHDLIHARLVAQWSQSRGLAPSCASMAEESCELWPGHLYLLFKQGIESRKAAHSAAPKLLAF